MNMMQRVCITFRGTSSLSGNFVTCIAMLMRS